MRSWRQAVEGLEAEIRAIVQARLRSLLVYEAHGLLGDPTGAGAAGEDDIRAAEHVHTLAVVDQLAYGDLARLAPLAAGWKKRGLAVPLFLAPGELRRSLDAFPLEFAQIVARHVVIAGDDPFADLSVSDADLRRACETQVRSHLLHLREGFIQAAGNPGAVSELVAASTVPLRALLINIARLHGVNARSPDALATFVEHRLNLGSQSFRPLLTSKRPEQVREMDGGAFFPDYLHAVERLATLVDEWAR